MKTLWFIFLTFTFSLSFCLLSFCQIRYIAKTDTKVLKKSGVTKSKSISADWQVFSITDTSLLADLRQAGIYIELDRQAQICLVPNDSLFNLQWGLTGNNKLWSGNFSEAWAVTEGSSKIKIGIIDSGSPLKNGIWTHPDLDSARFSALKCIDDDYSYGTITDDNGHSTAIAGIIGATKNNKIGIAGIDRYCLITTYKAFSKYGFGWNSDIAQAIYRAVHDNCKILSMSFGDTINSRLMENAISYAQQRGVICVVAAGNYGGKLESYPAFLHANFSNIISVGAINDLSLIAWYSNRGAAVDVYAPGGSGAYPWANPSNILSTFPTYGCVLGRPDSQIPEQKTYGYLAGTSMAVPFVTGTASLMLAANPNLPPSDVRKILIETADVIMTIDGPAYVLNPGAAVRAASINQNLIIARFILDQNYPNPFNTSTTIRYFLPKNNFVTLKIYDILGREIVSLADEEKLSGNYMANFIVGKIASGIYLYRLTAGNFAETKRMVIIK